MKYLPLLFTALSLNAATVILEWTPRPPEEQITEYRFYNLVGTNATLVATAPGTTNRVALTVDPGEYRFVGRSVNGWGESINSNEAKTPPLPKPPLIVTNLITVSAVKDANGNNFLVSVRRQ